MGEGCVSDLKATAKETREGKCCVTGAAATVDLSDNTLAVFAQKPRKKFLSQEIDEEKQTPMCKCTTKAEPRQIPLHKSAHESKQWHTGTSIM